MIDFCICFVILGILLASFEPIDKIKIYKIKNNIKKANIKLNHKLIEMSEVDEYSQYYFKCTKCNCLLYTGYDSSLYYVNDCGTIYKALMTCDEMIIKNIIE